MTKETEDKFIVVLLDHNGGQHNAVGVNCKTNLVWDHTENYSLNMTLENLDRCCGKGNNFDIIYHMAQLNPKRASKKRKYNIFV